MDMSTEASLQHGRKRLGQLPCTALLGALLVALFACALLVPTRVALALTSADGTWEYELDSGSSNEITLSAYKGSDTALYIPQTVDGYVVSGVGNKLFEGNATVNSSTLTRV